jgi:ribosomal protein S18 acetylase RimI-like enzyme
MPVCVADPSAWMRSIEANLHGQIACVHRRQASMVIWDEPAFLLADSGLPSDTFNKVARARLARERCSEEIGRAAGHFKAVGRPFAWWVGPSSRPLDIEERLQEMGFCATELATGMGLVLRELREAPLPAGLQVERVSSLRHLEDLSCVLAQNWTPPDAAVAPFYQAAAPLILQPQSALRYFVAYLDGEPAAVSGLYLEGGVGGIYSVATRRQFRRHGIGARLTWAAADEARRAGAALAVLQASPEGKEIYQRLGFQDCCCFAEYTPAGQGVMPAPGQQR